MQVHQCADANDYDEGSNDRTKQLEPSEKRRVPVQKKRVKELEGADVT